MARRQLVGGLVALTFVAGCAAHAATAQQGNDSRRPLTVRLTIPGTVLPAGRTRVPISIATTYTQCAQDPASATRELPACSHTSAPMMPPLPAGTYRTKVAMLDPHGVRGSTLGSVEVTLTD